MDAENTQKENASKPGVLAYNYDFNYFGGDKYKDKVITGAGIDIAIHVYKGDKEIKFSEEPHIIDFRTDTSGFF